MKVSPAVVRYTRAGMAELQHSTTEEIERNAVLEGQAKRYKYTVKKLKWDETTQSVACAAEKKRSLGGVAAIEDQMHAPESAARTLTRTKQAKHRRRRHAA